MITTRRAKPILASEAPKVKIKGKRWVLICRQLKSIIENTRVSIIASRVSKDIRICLRCKVSVVIVRNIILIT